MPDEERPDLVEILKEAMRQSGLSLSELARRSGLAASQLSHFAAGERTLTLPAAAKLCDALGYTLVRRELLNWRPKPRPK